MDLAFVVIFIDIGSGAGVGLVGWLCLGAHL